MEEHHFASAAFWIGCRIRLNWSELRRAERTEDRLCCCDVTIWAIERQARLSQLLRVRVVTSPSQEAKSGKR